MSVAELLRQAGLSHLIPAFNGVSVERFKTLLIQDYEKHGIRDINDKQALFRLIQELNAEDLQLTLSPEPAAHPSSIMADPFESSHEGRGDGFLDLEGDDDDEFLGEDLDAEAFSEEFIRNTTLANLSPSPPVGGSLSSRYIVNMGAAASPAAAPYTSPAAAGGGSQGVVGAAAEPQPAPVAVIPEPPRIRVIIRKRPLNKKEIDRGDSDVLECDQEAAVLYVNEPKVKVDLTKYIERHSFRFDDVFGEEVNNDELYALAIQPLIATIFRGGKATCFAYGQTGSGKTFTMAPLPIRAAADIFRVTASLPVYHGLELTFSCFEIYGGKVYDLLNKRQRLEVREDAKKRVQVVGLKEVNVGSVDELMQHCEVAAGSRSTGQTGANDESSRSHSIMTFALKCREPKPATIGKLSFIDLAGSERGADTYDNDKQTRMEGAEINKSLLALKECIRALDSDARHIPFRGSKLTSVLRDSFVGKNTRTVMIGCVSPNSSSCEHTLNTLRYADRVKEIRKDNSRSNSNANMNGNAAGVNGGSGSTFEDAQTAGQVAAILQQSVPLPIPTPATTPREVSTTEPPSTSRLPGPPAAGGAQHHVNNRHSPRIPPGTAATAGAAGGVSKPLQSHRIDRTPADPPASRLGGASIPSAPASAPQPPSAAGAAAASKVPSPMTNGGIVGRGSAGVASRRTSASALGAHPLTHTISDASSIRSEAEEALNVLLAAEEELIGAHKQHIDDTMAVVRDEMDLLNRLSGTDEDADIERYVEDLSNLLINKQAAISLLQQQVALFKRRMRAALDAAAAVSNSQ